MSDRQGTTWLTRFFRSAEAPRGHAGHLRYTVPEVKAALRGPAADSRARQIHDCLARIGMRLDDLPVRQRYRGLENYHQRLLRILTLYSRGWEADAIAAELSIFSTAVGVTRAIEVTAEVITEQLNRHVAA